MARYRNEGSLPLNYSDSGGPFVLPGEEFEHDIPPAQLESHLRSGFISEVPTTQGDPPPVSPEDLEAHPWKRLTPPEGRT